MVNSADSKFDVLQTEDGSYTIYHNDYAESMHSKFGAYEEALHKHLHPSKVLNLSNDNILILDIGFGIGYNVLAAIIEFKNKKPLTKLNIISFEKNNSHLSQMDSIHFNDQRDEYYHIVRSALKNGEYKSHNLNIKIIFGDARHSIKSLHKVQANAVFQDPFSPSKNPELWTVEFFREIYRITDTNGMLTTYSSAAQIRRGLMEAGFYITRCPKAGNKKEGTIASKKEIANSFNNKEHLLLLNDIKSTPYHDYTFNESRENILSRRINTMKERRLKVNHRVPQE